MLPRLFLTANHLLAVLIVAWLLFGGGIEIVTNKLGYPWAAGDYLRRILIFLCSLIYFLRIVLTTHYLLKRRMDWSECLTIVVWLYFIHLMFAFFGGANESPIGAVEIFGILLYFIGSYLNTGSEYLRKLWKENPENKGKLYTEGLFRYSMHINYLGDLVLFAGFALVAGSLYTFIIPVLMFVFFSTINIPMLDKYLAEKYGSEFEKYRRKTKKLIPFVY